MEKIIYSVDGAKARKNGIIGSLITIPIAIVLAYLLITEATSSSSAMGAYMMAGFLGAIIGACVMLGFIFLKRVMTSGKKRAIITTDNSGITVTDEMNNTQTIAWSRVLGFTSAQKGLSKVIAVQISNPDEYINSLPKKLKMTAKTNNKTYRSPFIADVTFCGVDRVEIERKLKEALDMSKAI